MSKVIAVAGGTGGIGQHVLNGLLKSNHKIILLSRKEQPELAKRVEVKVVDYSSVDSLKAALTEVDTVVSCAISLQGYVEFHRVLVDAMVAAGVKRYIPSEWAHDLERFPDLLSSLYKMKTEARGMLEKTNIEYTLVCNGLFMDYLLPKGAKSSLQDVTIPVNVEAGTALILGTGDEPVSLTLADDIGAAVAALVDEPKWEKYTFINGDTTTWNKILQLGEKITGKKFQVTHKSKEEIKKSIATATDPMARFYAEVYLAYAQGEMELGRKRDFKGVKFTSVEELLQKTYGKQ